MIGNQVTRRAFLKGTATVAAAIPFIKAERLMNVWTPPEPEIFTGYSAPQQIITEPYSYNFMVSGLRSGSQVMVKNGVTGEVVFHEREVGRVLRRNISENMAGTPLIVYARHPDGSTYMNRVGAPHPGGKTKIRGLQLMEEPVLI